ncbi:MAG: flavodoxin domain-containing protein [Terracidiphilus sp.]|jgi:menaquinone-dependent protoporphyrinogen oxidase
MRVLVAYASRYGATQGIAERIAATLRRQGIEATVESAQQAPDPASYDAAVIGSATYYFRWMNTAAKFVRRNVDSLAKLPVWLFSVGPLGTKEKDDQGRDLCAVLEPREIAEFRLSVKPRDHRVFFGVMDASKLGFLHRLICKLPANRDNALFPQGDFRNWAAIEDWAGGIAEALKAK